MSFDDRWRGLGAFSFIAVGQIISVTGSALTGFALGAWVYQQTQSTTQYSLILLFTVLPSILVAPWTGALVDRWDRRTVMIMADAGAALCTAILALLIYFDQLAIWQIYLITGLNSMLTGFQVPAYMASVSLLVPREQLGRANGIMQFETTSRYLLSPILAGWLMDEITVPGVMLLDLATFVIALSTLLVVRFPKPKLTSAEVPTRPSLRQEAAFGWQYIATRGGFVGLLVMFGLGNYANNMTDTLMPPMLLSFTSPTVLGSVLSAGGLGMLAGTVLMSVWGGPKRRVDGVIFFKTLAGVAVMMIGIFRSVPMVAFATFLYYFPFPLVNALDQAIWQAKVPSNVQGRVFAMRRMFAFSMRPVAYLTAGPLSDLVFRPLLSEGGALAASLGSIWGIGAARGDGLLITLMGLFLVVLTLGTALNPRVREIEVELPDEE